MESKMMKKCLKYKYVFLLTLIGCATHLDPKRSVANEVKEAKVTAEMTPIFETTPEMRALLGADLNKRRECLAPMAEALRKNGLIGELPSTVYKAAARLCTGGIGQKRPKDAIVRCTRSVYKGLNKITEQTGARLMAAVEACTTGAKPECIAAQFKEVKKLPAYGALSKENQLVIAAQVCGAITSCSETY